jgi:NADH-quinone oxidoreductase subunit M
LGILFLTPVLGMLYNAVFVSKNREHLAFDFGISFAVLSFVFSCIFAYNFDFANPSVIQFQEDKFLMLKNFYLYSVGVDGLSLLFVLLTNFLVILCLFSAKSSVKEKPKLFVNLFLLLQAFCIGLFVVKGIIWFYIFFEAILIPMFFIIGIWGGKNRIYASYKFFIYTFAGSVFFLLGLIYLVIHTGETDIFEITKELAFNPISLQTEKILWIALFLSLAIKVPMFPFHTWLPDAHVEAPTSGSVILAGILIKIGGFGMLRFLLPMFPNASVYFADFVIILSIIAVIYASLIAIMQEDIKKMIAYSSIAHMGFVTSAIFALNQNGVSASIFQMFSHGLVSGALFLCIGVLYERFHTREFKNFGGLASKMPNFAIVLMVFTMASAGLPTTSGFVGEFLTIVAVYQNSFYYSLLIGLSVIFGALYMLYMYKKTMFGKSNPKTFNTATDLNLVEIFSLGSLAILVIICGIYPSLIFAFIPNLF